MLFSESSNALIILSKEINMFIQIQRGPMGPKLLLFLVLRSHLDPKGPESLLLKKKGESTGALCVALAGLKLCRQG